VATDIFRCKSIDQLLSDSENAEVGLKKSLGWVSLTALGIGAVIGSGIFTVIGTAIAGQQLQASSILNAPLLEYLIHHSASFGRPGAGPAIALSFVLVAIVCGFASVCYAELAAMIPIAGSAYTYTYATMGELVAWIIGWDLILEYAVSNMAVCVGFSAHIVDLLDFFGIHPNPRWISPAYLPTGMSDFQGNMLLDPGWHFGFNFPAFLIVMLLTTILIRGIRESASANNVMVLLKITAILVFITFAARLVHPANWHPFAPNGWPGILTGGSIVFFTYIGFDSVSTAAEECKRPQRDLPIGIIATLIVCTLLYIGVVVVLTGLVPWQTLLDDAAPVVNTLKKLHFLVAGFSIGASARVVCDVSRRIIAKDFQSGASEISDSRFFDFDGGHRRRHSSGLAGYRNAGGSIKYWHAFCVRFGGWRSFDSALSRAGTEAGISRSGRADSADPHDLDVPAVDGGAADHQLDSFLCVDGHWTCDLLQLRAEAQHLASRSPTMKHE